MAFALRSKAAFVAHGGAHAVRIDDLFESMKDFGAVAHRFLKRRSPCRNNHEFLQVEVVVGVRTAVDDVHHRHRKLHGTHAAEIAVKGEPRLFGRSARHGHRDGENGVRAEAGLIVRTVQLDHRSVDEFLIARFEPQDRVGDFAVHVHHGLQNALAAVALLVAVSEFNRFAHTGGGARGNRRPGDDAAFQIHLGFDRRIAAAVQHFATDDINNGTHDVILF